VLDHWTPPSARAAVGAHRAERRREDDLLQPPDRLPRCRRGPGSLQGPGRHPPAAVPARAPGHLPVLSGAESLRRGHRARERPARGAGDACAGLRLLDAGGRRVRGRRPGGADRAPDRPGRPRSASPPRPSPTVSAGCWRLASRWPGSRRYCCSTSPPAGSGCGRWRRFATSCGSSRSGSRSS
jgi:hypothetical protein